ncbi:MAG: D-alanyl-D-alanine carboxypeptidase, partial [Rhodospirillaceae bacterium]|nr:D-alanyl-D-alanine carboxypeptidase [Rhodospirillaceae bacterium]
EYYGIFSEKSFAYGGISQANRNPLLYKGFGADGLKTGHTEASGYGLASSVIRNGRRLMLVVNGLTSMRERSSESARLLDWAFRETASYALFKKGDTVQKADVWLGDKPTVSMVVDRDVQITMPRRARRGMKVRMIYDNPVPAPIAEGTQLGRVIVSVPNRQDMELPLLAGSNIEQLGLFGRLNAAIKFLLWGSAKG